MALEFNPINFPWQLFQQAQEAQNRNRLQMNQDIAGLGTGLGNIGKTLEQQKAQSDVQKALAFLRNPSQNQLVDAGVPDTGATMPAGVEPQPDPYQLFGLYNKAYPGQSNPFESSVKEKLNPSSQWKVVPNMLSKSGKPLQESSRTGEIREAPFDVTPTGRGNSAFGAGSVTWDTASEEEKNLAQALYQGRMRPSDLGYRDRSIAVKLAEDYARRSGLPMYKSYAGNVAGKTAEAFAAGKLGQNALSLNTALGHVDSAFTAYNDISNTDQKWLNQPLNKLKLATGDPAVAKLGTTLNALRGELATVFKGSAGTDQEIESWMNYLNDSLTPQQINAVIPQVDELLRSRLSALEHQRSSGMSGRGEMPLLSPHGAAISAKFGKGKKQTSGLTSSEQAEFDKLNKRFGGR